MTYGDFKKLNGLLTNKDIVSFAIRLCDHFEINPKELYRKTTTSEVMPSPARRQLYVGQMTNLIRRAIFLGAATDEMIKMCIHLVVVVNSIENELDFRKSGLDNDISILENKYSQTDLLCLPVTFEDCGSVLIRDQNFYGVPLKEDANEDS